MTRATRMQYKAFANSKTSNKTISIHIDTYIRTSRIIANVILVYRDHQLLKLILREVVFTI